MLSLYRQRDMEGAFGKLAQLGATSEALRTKTDDLTRSGATSDADLKAKTAIHKQVLFNGTKCPCGREKYEGAVTALRRCTLGVKRLYSRVVCTTTTDCRACDSASISR